MKRSDIKLISILMENAHRLCIKSIFSRSKDLMTSWAMNILVATRYWHHSVSSYKEYDYPPPIQMANTPSKSAASQVTWLGLNVAWWLGKKAGGLALKWVVATTNWAVNFIRWPKPYIEISDTHQNGLKVLQSIASWWITHNYLARADYKNAATLQDFARLVTTKIIPNLPTGQIPLRFTGQGEVNKFWTDCLSSHGIGFIIA
jgi:hypothetical protein